MEDKLKLRAFHSEVFRAYDIRGFWPEELDHNTIELITLGFAEYIRGRSGKNFFLLGRDVRHSSEEISEEIKEILLSRGARVLEVGTVTTPMFTFAMARTKAAGGLMVTASHNSIRYNGLKLYERTRVLGENSGFGEIKDIIGKGVWPSQGARGLFQKENLTENYCEFLVSKINLSRKVKAVFDAGGGAAGLILPGVASKLKKVDARFLGLRPDPTLSLREPNPLLPAAQKNARKALLEEKAEAGFIFDPDGDRVMVLDEKGEVVRGDAVLWLLASFLAEAGDGVVYDYPRASRALREDLEEQGLRAVPSRAGHTFIKEAMRESGAVLGGELSGHFFFEDFFFADAAILAALRVLEIVARGDKLLSELVRPYLRYFHSGEINFAISDKSAALKALEEKFGDGHKNYLDGLTAEYPLWWFNLRPSNTENLLRLVMEARDQKTFEEKKEELMKLLMQLGASPV